MEISDLNEMANDVAVSRLTISELERQLAEVLESNPEIAKLQEKIMVEKSLKDTLGARLLDAMRDSQLKSWKTEQAVFSRAMRKSVVMDPAYKKDVELRLKCGEVVEGFTMNETEFMSIRINPKK